MNAVAARDGYGDARRVGRQLDCVGVHSQRLAVTVGDRGVTGNAGAAADTIGMGEVCRSTHQVGALEGSRFGADAVGGSETRDRLCGTEAVVDAAVVSDEPGAADDVFAAADGVGPGGDIRVAGEFGQQIRLVVVIGRDAGIEAQHIERSAPVGFGQGIDPLIHHGQTQGGVLASRGRLEPAVRGAPREIA